MLGITKIANFAEGGKEKGENLEILIGRKEEGGKGGEGEKWGRNEGGVS
jgi:hypothetical protein